MHLKNLKMWLIRTLFFPAQTRELFLLILKSQSSAGRTYRDIFRDMAKTKNKYFRQLATLALKPNTPTFAADFYGLFPKEETQLLCLSQRFNAVPEYIELAIKEKREGLSFFSEIIWANIGIILVSVFLTAMCIALTVVVDQGLPIDLTGTLAYGFGQGLIKALPSLLILVTLLLGGYYTFRNQYFKGRATLRSYGPYKLYDYLYVIKLFDLLKVLSNKGLQQDRNMVELISELSLIFRDSPLRTKQFAIVQALTTRGVPLASALDQAQILDNEELIFYTGLADEENAIDSVKQLNLAFGAVADILADKTRFYLKAININVVFVGYLYVFSLVIILTLLTLGAGVNFGETKIF